MKGLHYLLILLLLIFFPAFAFADSVGFAILQKGTLKIGQGETSTVYKKPNEKVPLFNGDKLHTGKDSQVSIELNFQGEKIEVFSRSYFKITKVDGIGSKLDLLMGKAHFDVKGTGKDNKRLQIRTLHAVIRGKETLFALGSNEIETNLLTLSGTISIFNFKAPEVVVEVSDDQVSQVKKNMAPTKPILVNSEVRQKILEGDTLLVFDGVKFDKPVKDLALKINQDNTSTSQETSPSDLETPDEEVDKNKVPEELIEAQKVIEDVEEIIENIKTEEILQQ